MIHLLIAISVAVLLGVMASRSLGKFLNEVLNKAYPASIYKQRITKKSSRKQRLQFAFSFQNIFTIAAMTGLSLAIYVVIISGIRYIPLHEKTLSFLKGDFSDAYLDIIVPFFSVLYTTVSIVCIDFYFYNLINNTPDERLKRLIDND